MPDTHNQSAESALEKRVREALNAAKMALWELNLTKGTVTWSGKVALHFLKFAQSIDGTLKGYQDKIHPDDHDEVIRLIAKAREGHPFVNQHRILFPDGEYHWVEGIGNMVRTEEGLKLTGTVRDINERKLVELDREEWKRKHEMVSTAAGVVVYDYDIKSGKIDWIGSTVELFGYNQKDLGDIDAWVGNVHPEDRKAAIEELDKAENVIGAYDVVYRFKTSSGDYKHVHDKGFFMGENAAEKMLGMMDDITDQVRKDAALKESEARFKSMIHDLNIGVGLYDLRTIPILCNRKSYELLGLTYEQFMGKEALSKDWKVITPEGNLFKPEEFPIPRAISGGKPIRETMMGVYRPSLNDWVWLMVDAEPVYDTNGEFRHVECTYSDITELRSSQNVLNETNQQLSRLARELQGRNKRLLEFAQIVSHNLRSPISSIVALTELHRQSKPELRATIVQHIDSVGKNALQTIGDLNDVLKVQQGNIENDFVVFEEVLSTVLNSYKGLMLEANAKVEWDFQAAEISYPKIYLESLFMNLLSNSIKYRRQNVACEIKVSAKETKKGDVQMRWQDNGQGIDLTMYGADVFQMGKTFHQNEDRRGVGLFLIRNQIESTGGSIDLTSTPGKGTIFKITFQKEHS